MEQRLRGVDILGLFFATVCLLEAAVCLVLQPGYRTLFAEFATSVPGFTRLMLEPATLVVAGLAPLAFVAEGVIRRRPERQLVARVVVAIVSAISLVAAFALGMYLPLLETVESLN